MFTGMFGTVLTRLRAVLTALITLGALFAVLPAEGALAAASAWSRTDHSAVRLISAVSGVGQAESLRLGLQFRMRPKWKIYWRSPGDAGYAPVSDWKGSKNVASATTSWPVPERYTIFGLNTFVYMNEVVLPIELKLREPGKPAHLSAAVSYLVCDQICVPYQARLSLGLPAGPANPTRFTNLIDRHLARVPREGPAQGLSIQQVRLIGAKTQPVLEVLARSDFPFTAPDLFVEGPRRLQFGVPAVELSGNGETALFSVPVGVSGEAAFPPKAPQLTLTLVDGARAMEQAVTAVPGMQEMAPFAPLLGILALALLGGLILNLMPCVLPVLSIKLLGVIGHGGGERRRVRLGFLSSAAGILFSFLVLATAAVAVRGAGVSVGWGVQFQQPAFLVAMSLIVTLFACNLWGLFDIRLPGWAVNWAARGGEGQGLGGSFATGAFATLLATPCSAPFLGTAIGFAFARGAVEIFAVFAALGIGLALPYLLVAALPGLATRLPRPGRWMAILRKVLGLALAATALWLISVLAAQSGVRVAVAVGILLLALVIVFWGRHLVGARMVKAARVLGPAAIVVLASLAFLAPPLLVPASEPPPRAAAMDSVWRPFDKVAILNHVGAGKIVFVHVTAEWCVTCQVNKALVLDRGEVAKRLSGDAVVAMWADWTRPNGEIAGYLASFGRYGIPFDAVYGPGAPSGLVLSELLTADQVLAALARAAGGA